MKDFATQMVKDHVEDVAEFRKESRRLRTQKSFAAKTLPTLEHHLRMAQDAQKTVGDHVEEVGRA